MSSYAVTWGIAERSLKLIPRVPSTFFPSMVMPIFLLISFSGAFSSLVKIPSFPAEQMLDWVLPMAVLQGCAFAGITTGLGVARDFETGYFDRFISSPAPRAALLAGPLLASILRGAIPLTVVSIIGFAAGVHLPGGPVGLLTLAVAGLMVSLIAGAWATGMFFRAKSHQVAPLVQMAFFLTFFLSTAQMPEHLLTGWVQDVARLNPMTEILGLARQGFIGDVTWATTWPGLVALASMVIVLGLFSYRGLAKVVD